MSLSQKQLAIRRYLAFGIDWLVIAVWAGVVFGMVMLIYSGQPPSPSGPWIGQCIGFIFMTLPFILYYSLCEASIWQATIGKRIMAIQVEGASIHRIPFLRSLLRNGIKFIPWELGHLIANQAIFSSSSTVPEWIYVPMVFSFLLPVWWVIAIYSSGVAPYDKISRIRVVPRGITS